jgi:hypothetical protein
MLPRHAHELMLRLERIGDVGCTEIRKLELPYWYGQERTTKAIWRDIAERWSELLEVWGLKSSLLVGEAEGVWVFVWGEGLRTPDGSRSSWLKDVNDLAGYTD